VTRRPLSLAVTVLIAVTLAQVVLGTQVREHIDVAMERGVARNAALSTVGRYDSWHRDTALLVLGATLWVVWRTLTRHQSERPLVLIAYVLIALVGVQLVLGATMAYVSLTPPAQVAHLIGASLVLGAETVLLLLARWLPERETKELRTKN
jgi:heme a synthase